MKIIYHCFGGAHSSVTAAALHLNWLPTDRLPETEELKKLPYFDKAVSKDHGYIRFMGLDDWNNEIYVLGRRSTAKILEQINEGLMEIYDVPAREILLFDVMPYVNWKMMLGGYTSRRMGLTWFGRPIIILGVKHSYWKILSLVQQVKVCIARRRVM